MTIVVWGFGLLLWATAFLRPFRDDEIQRHFPPWCQVVDFSTYIINKNQARGSSRFPFFFTTSSHRAQTFFFFYYFENFGRSFWSRPLLSLNTRLFDDKTLGNPSGLLKWFSKAYRFSFQNISLFSFWLFIHFEMVGGLRRSFLNSSSSCFLSLLYSLFFFVLFIGTHTQLFRHHQTYTHS